MATKPWLHNSDWKNLIPNTVNGEKIRASCCKPLFVIHINQTVPYLQTMVWIEAMVCHPKIVTPNSP